MKNGGPAFPSTRKVRRALPAAGPGAFTEHEESVDGMTLRDYFAAKAMQGLLAMCAGEHIGSGTPSEAAECAYKHADAMLAEREKGAR